MKILIFIIVVLTQFYNVFGQNFPSIESLNNFKYGQHISVLDSINYSLFKSGNTEDDTKYLAYIIDEKTETYIVFTFPSYRKQYINSIQITGYNSKVKLVGDINLGDSKEKVFRILGVPSDSNYIESLSLMHYSFNDRNYTVEIDSNEKLYSFEIKGDDGLLEKNEWPPNWKEYQPSSIKIENVATTSDTTVNYENDEIYFQLAHIFRPRVKYLGKTRQITDKNHQFLKYWFKTFSKEDYIKFFKHEIAIEEDSITYWFPIQESLIEDLNFYTRNGDLPIDLFISGIGLINKNLVMTVNEFVIW